MASRSLDDLAPAVRAAALCFSERCRARGFYVLIYCTLRSREEQAVLYAQGRTRPGRRVTDAQPGKSLHNPDAQGKAWAFDAVPLTDSGAADWGNARRIALMGAIGESCGLTWGGRWSNRDAVHFEIEPTGAIKIGVKK